jgi:hypothetical protein
MPREQERHIRVGGLRRLNLHVNHILDTGIESVTVFYTTQL